MNVINVRPLVMHIHVRRKIITNYTLCECTELKSTTQKPASKWKKTTSEVTDKLDFVCYA